MKKLLLLLPLVLCPVPARALTWHQFWEPFTYKPYYYYNPPPVYYPPVCTRRIDHAEYVPGNLWNPGYYRTWSEWIKVPCDY